MTRLPPRRDEVIDRDRTLRFSWNGRRYSAFAGDTIVSALAAAGERVFSRSFKYHRPRGVVTASFHDPGCMVQVGDEPNVRGAHRLVTDGMEVTSQNTWPSLRFDVKGANRLFGRLLGPGFYYKTFIRPQRLWPAYEWVLRRFTHAGSISPDTVSDRHAARYAHPDVVVAGGGPAGMAAAVAAARAGARVLLVEEEHQLGGHLRYAGGSDELAELRAEVAASGVEVLTDSVVLGRYDQNWVAILRRTGGERLIRARAGALVVACGLIERPYVFAGNDLPGVMLSTAARRLINLYAVRPGERAVVLTANADGDAAVADLRAAGVEIAEVVDARTGGDIVRAHGRRGLRAVELPGGRRVEADLLVTATGWTAPTALLNQAGDVPVYNATAARFLPGGRSSADVFAVGGIAGDGTLDELRAHATAVAAAAARHAAAVRHHRLTRTSTASPPFPHASSPNATPAPVPTLPVHEHPELFRASTHGIVDFSEDVSSSDIHTAVREGYDSAELAKRYTTATMGPLQGKLEMVNAMAMVAEASGSTLAETGTTTWRPMYTPVTLGALAGRPVHPVRRSPMQSWHEVAGAAPLVAGQWIRPDHYGDPAAEVRAVREGVGIIDVTPIGKLDLRGPDVPKLLNLLYVNKWSKLDVGRVRYGVMCAEDGVVLDDGVTGRLDVDHYLMSTTSSGAAAVWEWVELWLQTERPQWNVHVTPVTTAYASINVAGPHAAELVGRLAQGVDLDPDAFGYMNVRTARLAGVDDCVLWRIGFTGEPSYELHVPAGYGLHVWETLLATGADLGVRPFGVEAQRILRLEKGHLIVGQDTDGLTRAFDAGLDGLVKLDKDDFAGKPELVWQHERRGAGPAGLRLVGLRPVDGTIVPPEASQIVTGERGTEIRGRVTSSRMSPTLGRAICLGQVDVALAEPGTEVSVLLPDGRRVPATVTEHLAQVDPAGARLRDIGRPGTFRPCPPPVLRSAIDPAINPSRPGDAPPVLADHSGLAKVLVRAGHDGPHDGSHDGSQAGSRDGTVAAALGTRFGAATRDPDDNLVVGSGPGEWLVLGAPGTGEKLAERLRTTATDTGEFASVVDLTHGRALVRLTGERAADVLATVCAIDLAVDVTPNGAALRTHVAGLVTDLVRDDREGAPSYLLHCERSSGQSLWDALLDAGAEYGMEIDDVEER
ncbi:2Fe-2S iron-sulfur cluster-binding protein [Actinophytocola sp.]|uniref:2Fe-2S iron-sulfur cluster-binding protein n=1 Tax=Actinophytocola sp. TaxID=1872138 RepID=UPI003D6C0A5C